MANLIRCATCEGWGVTSYDAAGVPHMCERCKGVGKVEEVEYPPIEYALTACQAAVKAVLDMAIEKLNSNSFEARELAELVVKLFDDFELEEAEPW